MSFEDNDNNIADLLAIFQPESEEILERIFENLEEFEKNPANRDLSAALYRDLHSIKGAIRMVGFNNIQLIIHKIEDIFDAVNTRNIILDKEKFNIITRSLELVSKYLKESIVNKREIIGDEYTPTLSSLEYIVDVELNEDFSQPINSIIQEEQKPLILQR